MNRRGEAAERFAERRRREDEAPRLLEVAPDLVSCKIEIEERRAGVTGADVSHTRRVVVEHAPALFLVACGDPACRDGGHDITGDILRGLREHRAEIRGEDTCFGSTGSAECGRVIGYAAFAEYKPQV
ncbi:MAG: hypothetical protein KC657_23440 [Myxococcales bacterium]|jgi:hypothetical protein|nr:hypothetical protein [Myxococcales bacterium]